MSYPYSNYIKAVGSGLMRGVEALAHAVAAARLDELHARCREIDRCSVATATPARGRS